MKGTDVTVYHLDDHRPFDIGAPDRCWLCGTSDDVLKQIGDGGFVWGCINCGHPEDH